MTPKFDGPMSRTSTNVKASRPTWLPTVWMKLHLTPCAADTRSLATRRAASSSSSNGTGPVAGAPPGVGGVETSVTSIGADGRARPFSPLRPEQRGVDLAGADQELEL